MKKQQLGYTPALNDDVTWGASGDEFGIPSIRDPILLLFRALGLHGVVTPRKQFGKGASGAKVFLIEYEAKHSASANRVFFVAKIDGIGPLKNELARYLACHSDGTGLPDEYLAKLKEPNLTEQHLIASTAATYSAIIYEDVASKKLAPEALTLNEIIISYLSDQTSEAEISRLLTTLNRAIFSLQNSVPASKASSWVQPFFYPRWRPHYKSTSRVTAIWAPGKEKGPPQVIFTDLDRPSGETYSASVKVDHSKLMKHALSGAPIAQFAACNLRFLDSKMDVQRLVSEIEPNLIFDIRCELYHKERKRIRISSKLNIGLLLSEFTTCYEIYRKLFEKTLGSQNASDDHFFLKFKTERHVSLRNPLNWLSGVFEISFPKLLKYSFGPAHSDLHGDNVLVADGQIAIIDYGLFEREAPIGFDQAYLFGSILLNCVSPHLGSTEEFVTLLIEFFWKDTPTSVCGKGGLLLRNLYEPHPSKNCVENKKQFAGLLYGFAFIAIKWKEDDASWTTSCFIIAAISASFALGDPAPKPTSSKRPDYKQGNLPKGRRIKHEIKATAEFSRGKTVVLTNSELSNCLRSLFGNSCISGNIQISPDSAYKAENSDNSVVFTVLKVVSRLILTVSERQICLKKIASMFACVAQDVKILSATELIDLGFVDSIPGPFCPAADRGRFSKIIVDAAVYAESCTHSNNNLVLALKADASNYRIRMPIQSGLGYLRRVFGQKKMIVAALSLSQRFPARLGRFIPPGPVKSRFAPAPSGGLHLGNARTALIAYLCFLAAKDHPESSFTLRIDDTQINRNSERFVAQIKEELTWLGIRWRDSFRQTERHSNGVYNAVLNALEEGDLISSLNDGTKYLRVDQSINSIFIDIKRGCISRSGPLLDKDSEEQSFRLARPNSLPPYYRLAGIIDDIEFSTLVVRDRSQYRLTEAQSIIRSHIENCLTGKILQDTHLCKLITSADQTQESVYLKLPAYLHVQALVDGEGLKISKRNDSGRKFSLSFIRDDLHMPAEAVLTYLMATLSSSLKLGFQPKIESLAQFIVARGIGIALQELSTSFSPEKLADACKPIRFSNHLFNKAERAVMRAWNEHGFATFLKSRMRHGTEISSAQIKAISHNRIQFSSCRELVAVLEGPLNETTITSLSGEWLSSFWSGSQGGQSANVRIQDLKNELTRLAGQTKQQVILSDIRFALTGARTGPRVQTIIDCLSPEEACRRIDNLIITI